MYRLTEWLFDKLAWPIERLAVWAAFVAMVIVSGAQTFYATLSIGFMWALTVVVGLLATLQEWAYKRRTHRVLSSISNRQLNRLLATTTGFLEQHLPEGANIRANIMVANPVSGQLAIQWSVGMEINEAERGIEWEIGKGCTGLAFQDRATVWGDLSPFQHMPYNEAKGFDGQLPWGLTPSQWQLTNHLGSILAIPIAHPDDQTVMIGCLNVDSALPLEESGFLDERICSVLTEFAAPQCAVWIALAGIQRGGFT